MTTLTPPPAPKSYLSEEKREEILREMGENILYVEECAGAREAGDFQSAWGWLARADLPHYSLMRLKLNHGAEFIRKFGFKTAPAESAYGSDWLERDYTP